MCETSASVEYFLDGCLGKSSVCALSPMFPWLVLGEEMEVVRSHPHRVNHDESNALCLGEHCGPRTPFSSTTSKTFPLPFHTDPSKSIPYRPKQVHSTFRGASSVPAPWFFGWDICSSLSSSFGVLTACSADVPNQSSVTGTGKPIGAGQPLTQGNPESFHCHRVPESFHYYMVPDSFQLCLDSWKFIIEVHWTVRAPLVFVRYRACCLGRQV